MTAQSKGKRRVTTKGTGRGTGKGTGTKRWSAKVTRESDALELEPDVFKQRSARGIAQSLKRSAERSSRRKAEPYRSALSMLTFYINRAGTNLPPERKRVLTRAKLELRKAFGRDDG